MCGIEPVWASEIEPFPVKVTQKHFPNMIQYGDITKIHGNEMVPVNIIVGGSPCTDISVSGKMVGLNGDKSKLFFDQIRIIKEMRDEAKHKTDFSVRARYAVWENVPSILSTNGKEDFRTVLESFCQIKDKEAYVPMPTEKWTPSGAIMGNGKYSVAWRVLNGEFWGVPAKRRRLFLVADFDGDTAPEILFKRGGLSRNFAEIREAWEGSTPRTKEDVGEAICFDMTHGDDPARIIGTKAPTLQHRMGTGGNQIPLVYNQNGKGKIRRLTPQECAMLQGFPSWWCKDVPDRSDTAEYKMWGNGMCLPCVLYIIEGIKEELDKEVKKEGR